MTEKTSLEEELGRLVLFISLFFLQFYFLTLISMKLMIRLQQRGGRTLKERTRSTQIEGRLNELGRDITKIRRDLVTKPN